jgi:hypothetical protein
MESDERQLTFRLFCQGEEKPRAEWVLLIKPECGPVRIAECANLHQAYVRKEAEEEMEPIEAFEIHAAAGGLARSFGPPITRRRRRRRSGTQLRIL